MDIKIIFLFALYSRKYGGLIRKLAILEKNTTLKIGFDTSNFVPVLFMRLDFFFVFFCEIAWSFGANIVRQMRKDKANHNRFPHVTLHKSATQS